MSQSPISRRQLLKLLTAAAGTAVLSSVPNKWKTPVVDVGALPAHAQASGFGELSGYITNLTGPIRQSPNTPFCTNPGSPNVPGVTVSVDGYPLLHNTSDANGFYVITNVPAGAQNFTAQMGLAVQHKSGNIPLGSVLCVDWNFVIACLSSDAMIDTPVGAVRVTDIQAGMPVWTLDATGLRVESVVAQTVRRPVAADASIVHLVLSDGREVMVSGAHPTTDGRKIGDLAIGDVLDAARVVKAEILPYDQPAKYDLLPAGETGSYWANGIPMNSTIEERERKILARA